MIDHDNYAIIFLQGKKGFNPVPSPWFLYKRVKQNNLRTHVRLERIEHICPVRLAVDGIEVIKSHISPCRHGIFINHGRKEPWQCLSLSMHAVQQLCGSTRRFLLLLHRFGCNDTSSWPGLDPTTSGSSSSPHLIPRLPPALPSLPHFVI